MCALAAKPIRAGQGHIINAIRGGGGVPVASGGGGAPTAISPKAEKSEYNNEIIDLDVCDCSTKPLRRFHRAGELNDSGGRPPLRRAIIMWWGVDTRGHRSASTSSTSSTLSLHTLANKRWNEAGTIHKNATTTQTHTNSVEIDTITNHKNYAIATVSFVSLCDASSAGRSKKRHMHA